MDRFKFELEPGMKKINREEYVEDMPEISVIIPCYNGGKYIKQTVTSVLNQTFPYYEILIIDDGSTDQETLKILEEIKEMDKRISVFHKKNEGLATTRDYGAKKSSKYSKYLMILDDDDLIEPTFMECAYWTLETNPDAAWAYSDSIGFGTIQYTWNKYFNSRKLMVENELIEQALIRKTDFYIVNGYDLKEKAVNEDWNFWLKLIAKEKFPVHMSFYGQWYRRKDSGELQKATENQKRSLEIIHETSKQIKKEVTAIQYPKYDYNYDLIPDKIEKIKIPRTAKKNTKIKILFIIPWMIVGGADLFNLNLAKKLDKNKFDITIITTEPNKNVLRQEFEEISNVKVYDLTSFLDQRYWLAFINYIIEKENINIILNSNSRFGYSILPYIKGKYPNIAILDYIHMEEWYNRNGGYSRYSTMYNSVINKTLVCNANSKKILLQYFGKKDSEVDVVYIGVDENRYNPDKFNIDELKQKYLGKIDNKKIISFICRICEQKRPMLLLEIIKKLIKYRQDFIVLVVGNGNLLNKMKEEAQKSGVSQYMLFLNEIKEIEEIYKISDLTINCSIKEGIALTTYESLSMNVPVVSSDVGGQKELITSDVGELVEIMQDENDISIQKYNEIEISNYVQAVIKVLDNIEKYKLNCRKRICEKFTIDKMIQDMTKILEDAYKNPNKEKINNGNALKYHENITKEIITQNFENDEAIYKWECMEYEKNIYGRAYSIEGFDAKKEITKEKLWKNPLWRLLIKCYHKILRR